MKNINPADTNWLIDTKWQTDNLTATIQLNSIKIKHKLTCAKINKAGNF
jgi:hypothetical protein